MVDSVSSGSLDLDQNSHALSTHNHTIRTGDVVALIRADWCKIGVVKPKSTIRAGKDTIPLEQLIGRKYGVLLEWKRSTRQVCFVADDFAVDENDGDFADGGLNADLDADMQCDNADRLEIDHAAKDADTISIVSADRSLSRLIYNDSAPLDNRLVVDDPINTQRLSSNQILDLRSQGSSGSDMVRHLISNSATFQIKPVLTRDKYVRKKLSKHTVRFRVLRPSLQTIIKSYAATPMKISALRMDTLSYMMHRANVFPGGTHVVCDGVQGLLLGAVVHRVRHHGKVIRITSNRAEECGRAFGFFGFGNRLQNAIARVTYAELADLRDEMSNRLSPSCNGDAESPESAESSALQLIRTMSTDSLLIALRPECHPANVFQNLFKFLGLSRPFAVYCPYHEPLAEMFTWLRDGSRAVRLQLEEFETIDYQVLPERTHPENMSSNGGAFVLSGIKVEEPTSTVYNKTLT